MGLISRLLDKCTPKPAFSRENCPHRNTFPLFRAGIFSLEAPPPLPYRIHRNFSFDEEPGALFTDCAACGYFAPEPPGGEQNGLYDTVYGAPEWSRHP